MENTGLGKQCWVSPILLPGTISFGVYPLPFSEISESDFLFPEHRGAEEGWQCAPCTGDVPDVHASCQHLPTSCQHSSRGRLTEVGGFVFPFIPAAAAQPARTTRPSARSPGGHLLLSHPTSPSALGFPRKERPNQTQPHGTVQLQK